jgi:hypothetical protein
MKRQLRLYIMVKVLYWALILCPKDCINTLEWFSNMPFED